MGDSAVSGEGVATDGGAMQLRSVVPLLQVGNMADSLSYYQEVLGFRLDAVWPVAPIEGAAAAQGASLSAAKWAALSRDGVRFMLTVDLGTSSSPFIAEKGNGVVFYVVVRDVPALYAEMMEKGAIIVQELHDFGGREQFSVADPNGYVIAFSPSLP